MRSVNFVTVEKRHQSAHRVQCNTKTKQLFYLNTPTSTRSIKLRKHELLVSGSTVRNKTNHLVKMLNSGFCVKVLNTTVPLFRGRVPDSAELKSLMHTYSLSPGLVLGMVTSSTKVLGNWPKDRKKAQLKDYGNFKQTFLHNKDPLFPQDDDNILTTHVPPIPTGKTNKQWLLDQVRSVAFEPHLSTWTTMLEQLSNRADFKDTLLCIKGESLELMVLVLFIL